MELAELAIKIDSREAKTAEDDLKRLSDTGARTERSLEGVGAGGKEAARGSDATARSSRDATRAMDQQDSAAKRLTASVRYFAAASLAAGAAAATWMLSMSRSLDATNKMAQQIGVTTEALTGMRFAAQQFADISDQQFDMSMRRMTRRIEEAAQGGGAAKNAIEALGFSAQELARLSPDRQMLAIADAMQRTESQARRLQYTMALFDTEGMALVPALQQGSAAFEENIRLAQRYGVVLTTEAAQAASDFQTEVDRLKSIMWGFSLDLANQVLPTLNQFVQNAIAAATKTDGLHSEVKGLANDSSFKQWFDAALVGFARLMDVAVALAKSIGVVGSAFRAAAADSEVALAALNKAQVWNWFSDDATAKLRDALTRRNALVGDFNTQLDDLISSPLNRFEQAALKAVNTVRVVSDEIATVDLTVGSESAGASEEQLKKLAEWMGRLATPTEKLEETLAKARAELGSLFTPEIERRIRAQFAAQQAGSKVMVEGQKAAEAFTRERQQALRAQYAGISAIHDEAAALEGQIALFGLSKTAIEGVTIARLEEEAVLLRTFAGDKAHERIEAIEAEIEARKRLRSAMGSLEQKEAEQAAWDAWARDMDQVFQQVGQSFTDYLFDSARSARDMIRDLFKNLVLRVAVQPVMSAIQGTFTSSLGGIMGLSNPSTSAGSTGGVMGLAQNASTLYSAVTGGLTSTLAAGAASIGSAIGSSALTSFAAGMKGSTLAAGLAGPTTAGATGAMGLGATLGAALPWIGGGLAIASIIGGGLFDREPTTRRQQRSIAEYMGGAFSAGGANTEAANAAREMAQSAVDAANDIFSRVGVDAAIDSFYAVLETSYKRDKDGVASGGQVRIGDRLVDIGIGMSSDMTVAGFGGWSDADVLPRLATDIQLTVLEAFQQLDTQLPQVLYDLLAGVYIRGLGEEEAQALAQRFSAIVREVSAFQDAVEQLPFAQLRDLSFDASANILGLAGGLENLTANLGTYFSEFYSQEEQLQFATEQLGKAFSDLGLQLPDVSAGAIEAKQAYRDIVESLDLNTESGQQAYATLINLSGGFAELVIGMDELNNAVVETARSAADIAREGLSLETQLLQLEGNTVELRRRELEALDPSNRALQEHIWALQDQAEASRLASEAAEAAQQAAQNALSIAVSQGEAAYSALARSISTQKSRLQRESQAIAEALRNSISGASETVRELTNLTSRLTSTVQNMVSAGLDEGRNREWAQERISRALSVARLTGVMPQGDDFEHALQLVAQPSEGLFNSFEDYQADFLRTAHEIEALNELAGVQLTAEQRALESLERQLSQSQEWYQAEMERLDGVLEYHRMQLDIAMGTYEAELSQIDAIRAVEAAVKNIKIAQSTANQSRSWNASDYLANNPDLYIGYERFGAGQNINEWLRRHWDEYGRAEGRSFDVGTPYVPYDMTANIHRGEIIIDPRSSDILRRYGIGVQGGGNDAALRLVHQELREMRLMHQRLLDEIARNTNDTARTNKQMTMEPQPVHVTNVVPTLEAVPGQ